MPIPVWAIFAGFVSVFVAIIALGIWSEKRRTQQAQETSRDMGFEFLPSLPVDMDGFFSGFTLLNSGRRRKSTNVLRREVDGLSVLLFDHSYSTGSGKHQHRHHQTVAVFRSLDVELPQFRLAPEGWTSKISQMFGAPDIDFADSPEFSKKFLLSGSNEMEIREFFREDRRAALVAYDKLCLEASGNCLLVWFQNRRVPASGLRDFFEKTFEVFSLLKARQATL